MDLKARTLGIAEVLKKTKDDWVATEPENPDLAIYLHFFREDVLAVTVLCPVDRDIALTAAKLGASGFGADTMMFSFESYTSIHKESPVTNSPWVHQEMQYIHETYPDASEKGWVDSCISVVGIDRAHHEVMISLPYRLHATEVEWLDDRITTVDSEEEGEAGKGHIADYLWEAMSGPKTLDLLTQQAQDDPVTAMVNSLVTDPEEREFHTDMAVSRMLSERELCTAVVFAAEEGSNRAMWLKERLGEDVVLNYPDLREDG